MDYFILARYIEILSIDSVYIKGKSVKYKKILPASLANCFKLKLNYKKYQNMEWNIVNRTNLSALLSYTLLSLLRKKLEYIRNNN